MSAALLPIPAGDTPGERLASLRAIVPGRIVFTTSFGIEDQAITHWIAERDLAIDLVTLDTGRLFPETHALWQATEERYGRRIRSIHPDANALAALVADAGANGFYYSKEARLDCCAVRKVEPLNRALAGAMAWVTGLRADQSSGREAVGLVARDAERGLLKVAPLHDWSRQAVADFCAANAVPVNALHDRGFTSIGCAPCTRATAPGEPERAGRWWWERDEARECGLHVGADGRLQRSRAA
jgi:phosphoadenosine phosphosulfate reductase